MQGKRLLRSIRLKNLLSYGSEGETLELEPLNVLIGPNASGKSNLIDAISVLAATPRNLLTPFRQAGSSFQDWLWKGVPETPTAEIETRLDYVEIGGVTSPLFYRLAFTVSDSRLRIVQEELEEEDSSPDSFLVHRDLETIVMVPHHPRVAADLVSPLVARLDNQQSVLSQVRDPANYPQLTYVGTGLGSIGFFRGWQFGPDSVIRKPQAVNLPDDFLLEDASNLGLVLNDLQNRLDTKRLLLEKLKLLYEEVEDVTTKVQGGTIQIFFHEKNLDSRKPISAAWLSDGTLHYLCLLTILLHPEPPPLICLEEPELGLHPDILPKVADLLIDASRRTQLIVTTHSETLVSRLSEVPEAVVVCERDDQGTHLRRLEPEKLRIWLDKYLLGELWRMGEIGGNRW
ncbi:MAG TPA: AAA family ATPase [Thermoanaerobaculia bacterium]|jgi:predicted ATPase|nr:AAA family ATPase [Thermoanaerobaculia bacterium]